MPHMVVTVLTNDKIKAISKEGTKQKIKDKQNYLTILEKYNDRPLYLPE